MSFFIQVGSNSNSNTLILRLTTNKITYTAISITITIILLLPFIQCFQKKKTSSLEPRNKRSPVKQTFDFCLTGQYFHNYTRTHQLPDSELLVTTRTGLFTSWMTVAPSPPPNQQHQSNERYVICKMYIRRQL